MYANTHRSVKHLFNSVGHKMLYSNTHSTSPQRQSIDDSARYQRVKWTTTQILGVNVWRSSWACYLSYNAVRSFPWARYCLCKTAQQGAVRQLYRELRQLVCVRGMVRFMQIRNYTTRRFVPRVRLPEHRGILYKQCMARQAEVSGQLSSIDRRLLVRLLSVMGFMQLWNWANGLVMAGFSKRVTQVIQGRSI